MGKKYVIRTTKREVKSTAGTAIKAVVGGIELFAVGRNFFRGMRDVNENANRAKVNGVVRTVRKAVNNL